MPSSSGSRSPGGLQIVDTRQVAARAEAEVSQEFLRCRIEQRPAGALPAPGRPHPAGIHQHVERALRDLDAADSFDFGSGDRLVIGDDRQRLGRGARQPPRFLARAAQEMREVGRGLEMPTAAALDQLDPAALVMRGELAERDLDLALADMLGQFFDRQRLRRGEQGGFDGARPARPSGGPSA